MERILGSFDARQPNTWTADVQYRIFVSDQRAVAVRTGGQLAAELSGDQGKAILQHQLGILGVLVYKLLFEKRAARKRAELQKALEGCTMDELLSRHPKNFELPFHTVKRARLERVRFSGHGPAAARLVVEPQNRPPVKLLLPNAAELERCRALLGPPLEGRIALDPKLAAKARAA